jgi:DNA-binding NtrC family response regulator
MTIKTEMEKLIEHMLDGQITLGEAISEFEKLYIQKALSRCNDHLSQTACTLGIHRNTLSKRVTAYQPPPPAPKPLLARRRK